jgi:hypothetical protein
VREQTARFGMLEIWKWRPVNTPNKNADVMPLGAKMLTLSRLAQKC